MPAKKTSSSKKSTRSAETKRRRSAAAGTEYVSKHKVPFWYLDNESVGVADQKNGELIWGDAVTRLPEPASADHIAVFARGKKIWIPSDSLGGAALLEFYFIDVGQGDGVLVRTPDGEHLLVDGGYLRSRQPTGKNAADFVDWKFAKDYRARKITIDALIASHCDADHYGGLWDLIRQEDADDDRDLDEIEIGVFYHAGVGWWTKGRRGDRGLGVKEEGHLVTLIGSGADVAEALRGVEEFRPQGEWGDFLDAVQAKGCPVQRLSHRDEWLPGYAPDDRGDVKVRVLGPIEFERDGKPALKDLGKPDKNTNGHSILLRFDYGRARILLTGDLNAGSQQILMEHYRSEPGELECDVAKACHHGSDDCSLAFLQMIKAGATVISSGDNEAHAHPRPSIVAASALTGHLVVEDDSVKTPLIFSTEISRTVRVGKPTAIAESSGEEPADVTRNGNYQPVVHFEETSTGDLQPRKGSKPLSKLRVIPGVVYGLVNVRTDGETILCATMNEKKATFDVKVFDARF